MEDFIVSYIGSPPNADVIVTSAQNKEYITQRTEQILADALRGYDTEKRNYQSSVFPDENSSNTELTIEHINELATGIHSTLDNVISANEIILKILDTNPLFGLAYSIFTSVINTDYKLIYSNPYKVEVDEQTMNEVKTLIEVFNNDVEITEVIRNAISGSYLEGNHILYLALDKSKVPQIQSFPLSLCYPSYYMSGNDRILEFNVADLKTRLRKTYPKTKKNKAVYYDKIEEEVKDNYPTEIFKAFKDGEKVIKLDSKYGKCLTVNNYGRRFGLSPLFKALKPSIVVDNLTKADIANSKSRSKIIIFQKLSDKLLGDNGDKRGFAEQQLAHQQAASALQTSSCLYTAPAYVESLEYITPKNINSEAVEMQKQYNTQLLSALGISFYDSESATGTSVTVSYNGLLKLVNSIAESLSRIISRFYQELLDFYNFDRRLAPTISISPAEELDVDKKMELAKILYTTFNCSLETSLKYVGLDSEDEVAKRKTENENGTYTVMFPRATSYTTNNEDNNAGRPSETNTKDDGKQSYDKDYNKHARTKK